MHAHRIYIQTPPEGRNSSDVGDGGSDGSNDHATTTTPPYDRWQSCAEAFALAVDLCKKLPPTDKSPLAQALKQGTMVYGQV